MTDRSSRPARPAALLLVLVVCAVPMLVALGARDTTHTMENVALVTSQETWLRVHAGEPGAWLITTNDSTPRVRKPPMLAWLHMAAWSDLEPGTADASVLVRRARLVSVGLGLLLVAAVFLLGNALGGARLALTAALVCGTTLFLQRQARTASYDIHLAAFSAWGVAMLAWTGLNPSRRRLVLGIVGAAVATACASMGKNPAAFAFVAVGALALAACDPARRRPLLVALPLALVGALLLIAPWYMRVVGTVDGGWSRFLHETRQAREPGQGQPFYYYAGVLLLVMPWTAWLVSGLVHPFVPGGRGERRERLVGWTWFVGLVVLLSIPGAKQQRYLLPALPAAALLIARVWCDHERLAVRGLRDRSARGVIIAHWTLLAGATLALGGAAIAREPLIRRLAEWRIRLVERFAPDGTDTGLANLLLSDDNWPVRPFTGPVAVWVVIVLVVVLAALILAGARAHRRWQPHRAFVFSTGFAFVFFIATWHLYGGATTGVHPIRAPAEAFRARVDGADLVTLVLPDDPDGVLNEEFRFYAMRRFVKVRPVDLADRVEAGPDALVLLARDQPDHAAVARDLGMTDAGLVEVGADEHRRVWFAGWMLFD